MVVPSTVVQPNPSDEEWAVAIGRCVIAFGQLEIAVTETIRALGGQRIRDATARLPLATRCEIARAICLDGSQTDEHRAETVKIFDRLDQIRGKARNLVAHGAPVVFVGETQDQVAPVIISAADVDRRITYREVIEVTDIAQLLWLKLYSLGHELLAAE